MNPDALENVLENKGKKNVFKMIINRTLTLACILDTRRYSTKLSAYPISLLYVGMP